MDFVSADQIIEILYNNLKKIYEDFLNQLIELNPEIQEFKTYKLPNLTSDMVARMPGDFKEHMFTRISYEINKCEKMCSAEINQIKKTKTELEPEPEPDTESDPETEPEPE
jgi:hypothetical protein